MSLVLDTHALVWLIDGNDRLGQDTRQPIDTTWQSDLVTVSAITFWELALLQDWGVNCAPVHPPAVIPGGERDVAPRSGSGRMSCCAG
jgi:hypothetical protein